MAVSDRTGCAYGPWPTRDQAQAGVDLLKRWAADNLAGRPVDRLQKLQDRLWGDCTPQAAEVVSRLITETIASAEPAVTVPLIVAKSEPADQFTFGPLYVPWQTDLQGHATDPDTIQKAVWDWMAAGNRGIHLQHDRHGTDLAGVLVDCVTWPWPHTVEMTKGDGVTRPVDFPAGTAWVGVLWEDWAWAKVLGGEITGYSLAGRAQLTPAAGDSR